MSYAVSDEARENATRMIEKVPGVARMAMATGSPEYMSAFRSWLKGLGAPVYTAEEAQAVRASMSLTSANGGYALPFLLDPTLIHTGAATKNPIRQIARVESGTSDKWHGVTVSNVTTAWTGEGRRSPTVPDHRRRDRGRGDADRVCDGFVRDLPRLEPARTVAGADRRVDRLRRVGRVHQRQRQQRPQGCHHRRVRHRQFAGDRHDPWCVHVLDR